MCYKIARMFAIIMIMIPLLTILLLSSSWALLDFYCIVANNYRAVHNIFLAGGQTQLSRTKCTRKIFATPSNPLTTPIKLLLEQVFEVVSRYRAHFYHWMWQFMCWLSCQLTADHSKNIRLTNSGHQLSVWPGSLGGGAVALPSP